ncbi:MAG: WbqC family protein [Rhizobiales bacterium]|jgi:hypothetical protein|nr:WbqC family protein [Hyphomicrobiales bacterium]
MSTKKIAIMQPTYLPWIGYFALMDTVDEFVLLDDVQFARRSWQQRNQIKGPAGAITLTVPVLKKGKRDQLVNEAEINAEIDEANKHARSIQLAYAKAPCWSKYGPGLLAEIVKPRALLADYNIALIERVRDDLGVKTKLLRSSTLPIDGKREDRLVSICEQRSAGIYISPTGSSDYLRDSNAFQRTDIDLLYNDYKHPASYPQLHGEFVSHLSAIDLLLNCGERGLEILRSGINLVEAVKFHAR